MLNALLRLAQQRQTYTNLLYLLLAFPLGLIYFILLVLGISLGLGMLVLIIGIPIIALFISIWWLCASFERKLAVEWLHVDVPPMRLPLRKQIGSMQKVQAYLSNAVTWKSMAYLFVKFPFGLLAFILIIDLLPLMLVLGLVTFMLGFVIAPFFYLFLLIKPGEVKGISVRRYALVTLTGGGLFLAPLYLFNLLAMVWGGFARVMLGMSDQAMRLAQANALAEQERARAEQADRSRRELIINVSHELRTPIASIRGHIESLLAAYEDGTTRMPAPETMYNYLNIVHRESIRLGMLVNDLLSLARSETNELSLNMAAVEVNEVVEEAYQALMPLARRERQITLVRGSAPYLPRVVADRQRLLQVLLNLVRNAIMYTPDGGIVAISLSQVDAGHVVIEVSDTGVGIAAEDQQHVFERFYRTDASRARSSGGFGLGLAIVRDLVAAMNGSVSVKSEPGVGSCFRVLLCIA